MLINYMQTLHQNQPNIKMSLHFYHLFVDYIVFTYDTASVVEIGLNNEGTSDTRVRQNDGLSTNKLTIIAKNVQGLKSLLVQESYIVSVYNMQLV